MAAAAPPRKGGQQGGGGGTGSSGGDPTNDKKESNKNYPIPFKSNNNTNTNNNNNDTTSDGFLTLFNAASIMDYVQREVGGAEYPATRASVVWPPSAAQRHGGSSSTRGGADSDDDGGDDASSSTQQQTVFLPRSLQTDNFTREKRLVPGEKQWVKASTYTFPTPLGFKTITADGVVSWLKGNGIPFITDMLPSAADPVATLRPYAYTDVDEMRFILAGLAQYIDKGWLDAEGKLTGLAKRDMKKNCKMGSNAGSAAGDDGGTKKGGKDSASPVPEQPVNKKNRPGKTPGVIKEVPKLTEKDRPQRNVKLLFDDHMKARYPHTPPNKSAVLSTEQDPNQPRHKPLYKSVVTLPAMKGRKIEGGWQSNKRDAENAVYEKALELLLALPMGK